MFRGSAEAVSPVIGVVLMLGLTVIMISAVAVSVLAFTLPENPPQAKIVVVEAKGDLYTTPLYKNLITLKHKGGDALSENETRIIITGKGYAYASGNDPYTHDAKDIRVTYVDLTGENYIESYDGEIVDGNSWDSGETITLYGSDGRDLEFTNLRNAVDKKWKIDADSTVLVTIVDIPTNSVIAVFQATVKHP